MTSMRSSARSVPSIAARGLSAGSASCSRYSVKIRTRRSFHCGGCAVGLLAERRQVRAEVLADPVDRAADLGVGQVPRASRRSPSSRRAAPARGATALARRRAGAPASAAAVAASICALLLGLELLVGQLAALVVGVRARREQVELGCARWRPARRRPALAPTGARRSRGGPRGCARTPRSRRAAAAGGRRRAGPRRPARGCVVLAKRSSRAVRYSSSRRESRARGRRRAGRRSRRWTTRASGSRPGSRGGPP